MRRDHCNYSLVKNKIRVRNGSIERTKSMIERTAYYSLSMSQLRASRGGQAEGKDNRGKRAKTDYQQRSIRLSPKQYSTEYNYSYNYIE